METPLRVIVIGGGFSAAAFVFEFFRQSHEYPDLKLDVTVIERTYDLWKGPPYSTKAEHHLLNVPSSGLSMVPEDPTHFLRWIEKEQNAGRLDKKWGTQFNHVPRKLLGKYIEETVQGAVNAADPKQAALHTIRGDVVRVRRPVNASKGFIVGLRDGRELTCDIAILAFGNLMPSNVKFPNCDQFYASTPRYIQDPWESIDSFPFIKPNDRVCLIGSRLTMADVCLTLLNQGHKGQIHVVSRMGVFAYANHAEMYPPAYPQQWLHLPLPDLDKFEDVDQGGEGIKGVSVDDLGRKLMKEWQRHKNEDPKSTHVPWQSLIDSLRLHTNNIWRSLSTKERTRFLTHWRDFWEIHRHRMAPETERALLKAVDEGKVKNWAGAITGMELVPTKGAKKAAKQNAKLAEQVGGSAVPLTAIEAAIAVSGEDPPIRIHFAPFVAGKSGTALEGRFGRQEKTRKPAPETLEVDWVLNCTGTDYDYNKTQDPLVSQLRGDGLIQTEPCGAGLLIEARSGAVYAKGGQSKGVVTEGLYALGPPRKGSEWECAAVKEIKIQGRNTVRTIFDNANHSIRGRRMARL